MARQIPSNRSHRLPLDLFPLHTVLFPRDQLPLHIFEPRYRMMIQACIDHERPFGVVLIRSGGEVGPPADPCAFGTTARIVRHTRLADGRMNIEAVGEDRFRINQMDQVEPHLTAHVTIDPMPTVDLSAVAIAASHIRREYHEAIGLALELQGAYDTATPLPKAPEHLAYHIASRLPADTQTRQQLLESATVDQLLTAEASLVHTFADNLKQQVADRQALRLN